MDIEIFNGDYAQVVECELRENSPYVALYTIEQTPDNPFTPLFHYLVTEKVKGAEFRYRVLPHSALLPPDPHDSLTWQWKEEVPRIDLTFAMPNSSWGQTIARSMAICICVGILPYTPMHFTVDNRTSTEAIWAKMVSEFINQTYDKMIEKSISTIAQEISH
jgi:hypothetical protein